MNTLFDLETGEIAPTAAGCPSCESERARSESLHVDLLAAEGELRRLRRRVLQVEDQLRKFLVQLPENRKAQALFRYWVTRCGKNGSRVKFGDKRQKAVIARLREGHEGVFIARAIDGLAVGAYVNPQTGVRFDDLELLCRDEVHLERFHDIAERTGAPTLVGPAWRSYIEEDGDDDELEDFSSDL